LSAIFKLKEFAITKSIYDTHSSATSISWKSTISASGVCKLEIHQDVERLSNQEIFSPIWPYLHGLRYLPAAQAVHASGTAAAAASKQSACDQVNLRSLNPCARSV